MLEPISDIGLALQVSRFYEDGGLVVKMNCDYSGSGRSAPGFVFHIFAPLFLYMPEWTACPATDVASRFHSRCGDRQNHRKAAFPLTGDPRYIGREPDKPALSGIL